MQALTYQAAVVKHIEIPRVDAGKIIGKQGATRKDLEATYGNSNPYLVIPNHLVGVVISINSPENVAKAKIDVKGPTVGLVDAAVLAIFDLVEEDSSRGRGRGRGRGNGNGPAGGGGAGRAKGGRDRDFAPADKPKTEGKPKAKVVNAKLDDLQSWPDLGK
jgi:hypothetical protein